MKEPRCRLVALSLSLPLACAACGGSPSTPTSPAARIAGTAVTRDASACKLPAQSSGAGLGFPRVAVRLKAAGDVRVAVVFVDFPDAPATRTTADVFSILSPTAESYYRAVSYGRMNLVLEPTHAWLRMSKASTAYGFSALTFALHKAYIQEALSLAEPMVDFSQADAFVIVANPSASGLPAGPAFLAAAGTGVVADGKMFLNGATSGRDLPGWGGYWLNHEMGHTLGLPDLYAPNSGPTTHRYVGGWSLMGNIAGHAREFFGWERWVLGWLDDGQVACADTGATEAVLTPVERSGGVKIVAATTGATSAVVVESRRLEGYDTNGSWLPGALVSSINVAATNATGPIRVQPANDTDTSKTTAALQVGERVTVDGVTVEFLSSDASGDLVRVTK